MNRHGWMRAAVRSAAWVGLFGWSAVAAGAGRDLTRAFDLAVQEVEVHQVSSTPMFREVEVRCVVANRGPKPSSGQAWAVISRPGDDKPKVLKKILIPESLAPGDRVEVRAEGSSWFATPIPYRCEIEFGNATSGDADPNDDFGEFTYPKL